MSRYTLQGQDVVVTIGMDFAIQWWLTDHRGESVPVERPARLMVKDALGQVLLDAEATGNGDDPGGGIDPMTDAWLVTSPVNGMLQLTIPRAVTSQWVPNRLEYDLWATVYDGESGGAFPSGQQLPVARGRFLVQQRITQMEAL